MPETTIATHGAAIQTADRIAAAKMLQELVVDLTDLSLQGKQAHWNLYGPAFRELHLLLDDLVDSARAEADTMAERCLALGAPADARLATLSANTHLDPFPEGRVEDRKVVELIVSRLETISATGRRHLDQLGKVDLASQDLVITLLEGVEKYLWMFDAHRVPQARR